MDSSSGFWYLKLMHIDFNIELWHSLVIKLSRTVHVYFLFWEFVTRPSPRVAVGSNPALGFLVMNMMVFS